MFVFSLTTKRDYYQKGDAVFSDDGHVLGRVLSRHKIDIIEDDVFYTYDVDSTRDVYEDLVQGKIRLYRAENYSVSPCNIRYIRE